MESAKLGHYPFSWHLFKDRSKVYEPVCLPQCKKLRLKPFEKGMFRPRLCAFAVEIQPAVMEINRLEPL